MAFVFSEVSYFFSLTLWKFSLFFSILVDFYRAFTLHPGNMGILSIPFVQSIISSIVLFVNRYSSIYSVNNLSNNPFIHIFIHLFKNLLTNPLIFSCTFQTLGALVNWMVSTQSPSCWSMIADNITAAQMRSQQPWRVAWTQMGVPLISGHQSMLVTPNVLQLHLTEPFATSVCLSIVLSIDFKKDTKRLCKMFIPFSVF